MITSNAAAITTASSTTMLNSVRVKLPPKKYITTLDIGYEIAVGKLDMAEPLKIVHKEKAPILARKDGRVYAEFHEHQAFELCWGWMAERWHEVLKVNYSVAVEPQMSLPQQGNDRMCIILANTFYTIFNTLHAQGLGPPCIFVPPTWWREAAGAKAERTGTNMKEQYKANKARSVTRFVELYGQDALSEIRASDLNGGDYHDIPEAILMAYALATYPLYLEEKLFTTSHHHGNLFAPAGKIVKKEERIIPVHPIDHDPILSRREDANSQITPKELLIKHRAYKDQLLVKKEERKGKREAKKISKTVSTLLVPRSSTTGGAGFYEKPGQGGESFKSASKKVKR
jgi:hypothetical protein